jgi:hypothetical protein
MTRRLLCSACGRPAREVTVGGEPLLLCPDHEVQALRAYRAALASLPAEPGRGSGIPTVSTRRVKR